MATYHLEVDSDSFRKSLRKFRFRRLAKSKWSKPAIFSYNGVDLAITTLGIKFTVPAKGRWPTPVRASAALLTMVAQSPLHGDQPTAMSFDGERLCVADCFLSADADEVQRRSVDINLDDIGMGGRHV